jgi:hypothetical protein
MFVKCFSGSSEANTKFTLSRSRASSSSSQATLWNQAGLATLAADDDEQLDVAMVQFRNAVAADAANSAVYRANYDVAARRKHAHSCLLRAQLCVRGGQLAAAQTALLAGLEQRQYLNDALATRLETAFADAMSNMLVQQMRTDTNTSSHSNSNATGTLSSHTSSVPHVPSQPQPQPPPLPPLPAHGSLAEHTLRPSRSVATAPWGSPVLLAASPAASPAPSPSWSPLSPTACIAGKSPDEMETIVLSALTRTLPLRSPNRPAARARCPTVAPHTPGAGNGGGGGLFSPSRSPRLNGNVNHISNGNGALAMLQRLSASNAH